MSTVRTSILEALDDAPQSRAAIIEATGLDEKQVGNALNQLKDAGKVRREKDGWTRVAGNTQPKAVEHKTNGDTPPKRAYTKRFVAAPAAKANGAAHPVEFTYFGEFVVMRRTDVAELLTMLDRWRAVIEAA